VHTYYLGAEEVKQYAKDFIVRLEKLDDNFPSVWCPIGQSGENITVRLGECLSKGISEKVSLVPLSSNKNTGEIYLEDEADAVILKGASVLIIDSAVHSGKSMYHAVQKVEKLGASQVASYSLVVKRGSFFIPNFFSLLMGDNDRAYFLLDSIPNNRMTPSFGTFRKLSKDDAKQNPSMFDSGLPSMNKTSWADLWYECVSKLSSVYVYEQKSKIHGFVSFKVNNRSLVIDALAVDKGIQKNGVAGSLMRWAETCARLNDCCEVSLWAIKERIDFYRRKGFESTPQELILGDEEYTLMRRAILYNVENDVNDFCSAY